MRIVVDLNRCESYGQCVFAAPSVFTFVGEESLEYDYAPDDMLRSQVELAAAACPTQAIRIGRPADANGRAVEPERAAEAAGARGAQGSELL
jgi:ferredoxin